MEMYPILLGLQTFGTGKNNAHIRVMCNNMTAVVVLNHMCTSLSNCCNNTGVVYTKGVWLSVAQYPGKAKFHC